MTGSGEPNLNPQPLIEPMPQCATSGVRAPLSGFHQTCQHTRTNETENLGGIGITTYHQPYHKLSLVSEILFLTSLVRAPPVGKTAFTLHSSLHHSRELDGSRYPYHSQYIIGLTLYITVSDRL